MIEGLSHITLITRDLERMSAIIEHVLDGKEIYSSGDETFSLSREKFFIVGGHWIAVMEGESLPSRTYNHIAFKIAASESKSSAWTSANPARGSRAKAIRCISTTRTTTSSSCIPAPWSSGWSGTGRV